MYVKPSKYFSPAVAIVVASTPSLSLMACKSRRTPWTSTPLSSGSAVRPPRTTLSTIYNTAFSTYNLVCRLNAHDNASLPSHPPCLLVVDGVGLFVCINEDQIKRFRGLQVRERLCRRTDDNVNLGRFTRVFKVGYGNLQNVLSKYMTDK